MTRDNAVKIVFILLNFILIFFSDSSSYAQKKVEKGVLDLRYEQVRKKIIKLNGEWEFYWNEHLLPSDFIIEDHVKSDTWGMVPSYWINYSDEIPGIKNTGYATYRMIIYFPDNIKEILFDIPVFDSAFRIYIDGEYAGDNGLAGKKETETKPLYDPFAYKHIVKNGKAEIIINVSNFHHRRGGFWIPISIGIPEVMIKNLDRQSSLSNISAGILLSFITFFLIFSVVFRGEKSMLFFSLASLGLLLRSISTGSFLVMTFLEISWNGLIRLEYTGSFLALIFGSWYFQSIFPDKYFRIICTSITVLFSLGVILVISSPVIIFANSIRIFIPFVVLILLYYGAKSILSLLNAKSTGILNIIGFIALLLGAINDITLSGSNIFLFSNYIFPYSAIIFIFMQVIILIKRWVSTYNHEKNLVSEIEYMNQNLEKIVSERTSTLINEKNILEKQKEETEVKNAELEKNIHIKNHIFTVISNDLKTPIVNLAMLIENTKNISNPVKRENLMEEIGKQVDYAFNLVDNLIIWGKSQQKQLDYRPGRWNITDIVLECFNLYNAQAELKNIHLSYSHRGSTVALFDRYLVTIILRNLINNAIKYTPDNGKIYVTAEEVADVNPVVKVSVKDTGVGMDHESLENFKKFNIATSTEGTRGEKGTGLGLQLCYNLINIYNGDMNIESTRGEGTIVSFTLPLQSI